MGAAAEKRIEGAIEVAAMHDLGEVVRAVAATTRGVVVPIEGTTVHYSGGAYGRGPRDGGHNLDKNPARA